ncbi:hypothetical protein CRM73_00400 [Kocuria sp. CCUG 69068]|uniref:hypothetical protein n=1 Tax=Kocuria sp. CCUG 69068 TaxID=2043138 RepID=UPI001E446F47|nr:hypothetical protein [Kocuria sp. CCUG 69068]
MPESAAPHQISSYEELYPHVRISGIQYYDIHARATPEQQEPGVSAEGAPVEPELDLKLSKTTDGMGMRIRFETDTPVGYVLVDGAMLFDFDEPLEVTEAAALEFVNRTGFMAYVPYLRQMLEDVTGRCFAHPLRLPIIALGDFRFGDSTEGEGAVPENDKAVDSTSPDKDNWFPG